jgi:hypothetical protein
VLIRVSIQNFEDDVTAQRCDQKACFQTIKGVLDRFRQENAVFHGVDLM